MSKKATLNARVDEDLKNWIQKHTKDLRRGVSGFVEDACAEARRKIEKK